MGATVDMALDHDVTVEVFSRVLENAETELVDLELGTLEPARSDVDHQEVLSLRRALEEIVRAKPSALEDLAFVCGRLDEVGLRPAWSELAAHPHLIQAVRLSLEIFFRRHPDPVRFAAEPGLKGDEEGLLARTTELWLAKRGVLVTLRRTLN